jgi:hypothetical protein
MLQLTKSDALLIVATMIVSLYNGVLLLLQPVVNCRC